MPLSINVGLSRKASKDYQSTGVSINVTAELDQSLLAKPLELQEQIDELYAQAEAALDRRAAPPAPARRTPQNRQNGHANAARNGTRHSSNGNGHNNGNHIAGLTESQRRAILAIASRGNMDADTVAHDEFGTAVEDLTIRQASQLIDMLKAQVEAQVNGGGR